MIGKLLDGRYQVTQILSRGGFGRTFLAQDTKLPGNPICVVKQLHPVTSDPEIWEKAKELFEREAKTLQKLGKHPNIPQLLAYFEEDGEFYLVEEYIVGQTLLEELTANQPLSEAQVIKLLKELLEVLSFVHKNHVIHRDIKPENIIRQAEDQQLFLIDFGSVKEVAKQEKGSPTLIGTPGYMPNEQIMGDPQFSSDIYALGIICIQALTGQEPQKLPRERNFFQETIIWRDLVEEINPTFVEFLDKMIVSDYRERYPSAQEALAYLSKIIDDHQEQQEQKETEIQITPIPKKQNFVLLTLGSLLIILLLGLSKVFLLDNPVPSPRLPLNGKIIEDELNENDQVFEINSLLSGVNSDTKIYYYKVYYFQAKQGQNLLIEMNSKKIDPYLKIESYNGLEIASNDDVAPNNRNARIQVTLPEDGIYRVLASSSEAQEVGKYKLFAKILDN